MKLTVNPHTFSQKNNKPNFKAVEYYNTLKHLPDTPCACCGKKVVHPEALTKAWAKITKPLKLMIEQGKMNAWKQTPEVWEKLKLYAQINPDMSLDAMLRDKGAFLEMKTLIVDIFKPKGLEDGTKECIKADAEVSNLFASMLNHSRRDLKKAGYVMEVLEPFKECLKGPRLDIFKQFQIYAQKYPNKTLSEIVQMDEIFKFHQAKSILQLNAFREEREYHFNRIAKHLEGYNEEYFAKVKEFSLEQYEKERDLIARRENIKTLYRFALDQYGAEEETIEKVMAEIDEMPMEFQSADSFFVKAKLYDFSDMKIINSIFTKALGTYEHIIPASKEGKNSIYNGIMMCRSCNENRSDKPYDKYIRLHPEMKDNIRKQMKHITNALESGELEPIFEFYPVMMDPFLKEQCKDIDISEISLPYAKRRLEKAFSEKQFIDTNLQKLKANKDKAIKEQLELIKSKNEGKITSEELQVELNKIKETLSLINNAIEDFEKKANRNGDVIRVMSGYIEKQEDKIK